MILAVSIVTESEYSGHLTSLILLIDHQAFAVWISRLSSIIRKSKTSAYEIALCDYEIALCDCRSRSTHV